MARTAVTVTSLTRNASNAVTKTAFDIANDHYIDLTDIQDEDLTIFIETLDTKAATFVVNAGSGLLSAQGTLSITTGAAGLKALDLETARFKDTSKYITIDITSAAGATGNIYAVKKK